MISPKNVPGKVIEFNTDTQQYEERLIMEKNIYAYNIKMLDNGVSLDIAQDYRTKFSLVFSDIDAAFAAIKQHQSAKTEFKFK